MPFSLFAFHIHLPIVCYAPFLQILQMSESLFQQTTHTAYNAIIVEQNILHQGADVFTSKTSNLRER